MIISKYVFIILLNLTMPIMASEVCEQADDLLYQAYDLYSKKHVVARQKRLLERALQLCPNTPTIHNALAFVLENSGEYSQAIEHYKQALKQKPDLHEAWYDLGELYYEQNQLILSLAAHLNICAIDSDAKTQIQQILQEQQYAIVNHGQIASQENLLLLYDPKADLNKKLAVCGINFRIQPMFSFYNLKFRKNILHSSSKPQIIEIAAILRKLYNSTANIHVHTDTFANMINRHELNLKLSQERSTAIAEALVELGVSQERIKIFGHGYQKPIAYGISSAEKNTRVEIEIVY